MGELVLTRRPAVALERNVERITVLAKELSVPYIICDATEEASLKAAGIEQAKGLLAALGNDHDNLFIVITARSLNPRLPIIARGSNPTVIDKMKRVGADEVIFPEAIGGLRMVSSIVRPAVVSFLDQLLGEREQILRVEEVHIGKHSSFIGKRLADTQIPQRWNTLVLACRRADGSFVYNPPVETILESGMTLIVMSDASKLEELRRFAGGE